MTTENGGADGNSLSLSGRSGCLRMHKHRTYVGKGKCSCKGTCPRLDSTRLDPWTSCALVLVLVLALALALVIGLAADTWVA